MIWETEGLRKSNLNLFYVGSMNTYGIFVSKPTSLIENKRNQFQKITSLDFDFKTNSLLKEISDPVNFPGIQLFETNLILKGSAICLPKIGIFIHSGIRGDTQKRILQHEYGHFLDYKLSKDLKRKRTLRSPIIGFYLGIGIPSMLNTIPLINKIPGLRGSHRDYWTEVRANRLAAQWFGDRLAADFSKFHPSEKA